MEILQVRSIGIVWSALNLTTGDHHTKTCIDLDVRPMSSTFFDVRTEGTLCITYSTCKVVICTVTSVFFLYCLVDKCILCTNYVLFTSGI